MKNNYQLIIKVFSVLLVAAFLLSMTPTYPVYAEDSESVDPIVVVSLGDSYSSGEGVTPFYGQDKPIEEKIKDENWLAHRSTLAWPAQLEINGKITGKYNVEEKNDPSFKWYFKAVSGAKTENFKDVAQKKTARKIKPKGPSEISTTGVSYYTYSTDIEPQLSVFKNIKDPVDYVTFTIGGNDVDFADIITKCATGSTYLNLSRLNRKLEALWIDFYKTTTKIEKAYQDVQEAAGSWADILVVGYPQLLDNSGRGAAISQEEALTVNQNVMKFNDELKHLVSQCQKEHNLNLHFVDVQDAFSKNQAYSKEPWINPIMLVPRSEDINDLSLVSSYSMHPNEAGCAAYATCVNDVIKGIEEQKKAEAIEVKAPKQKHWVVYEAGDAQRLMMATTNIDYEGIYADWKNKVFCFNNYNGINNLFHSFDGKQYYFNEEGKWIYEDNPNSLCEVTRVVASDLNVYDSSGLLVAAKSNWDGHDWKKYSPIQKNDEDYVEVRTVEDLEYVRSHLSGKFILMNDLDLSNLGEWTPICSNQKTSGVYGLNFSGTFDGNGHKITGIKVTDNSSTSQVGLFSSLMRATIKNIADISGQFIFENATGRKRVGAVTGYASGSTITGCNSHIDISVKSTETESTTGDLREIAIGGIAGMTVGCNIERCSSMGILTGTSEILPLYIGGIIGTGTPEMANCYSACAIFAVTNKNVCLGGIAGNFGAQTMANCYSESSLYLKGSPETSYIGGIVGSGRNNEDTKLTNCYYLSASATTGVGWLPKAQAEGTEVVATIDVKPASKSQIDSAVKNLGLTAS